MSIKVVLPLFINPVDLEEKIGKDQLNAWDVDLVDGEYEKRKEMRRNNISYFCFTPSIEQYDNFHKPVTYWSSVTDLLTEYPAKGIYQFNSNDIVNAFKAMINNINNPEENKLEYNELLNRYIIP